MNAQEFMKAAEWLAAQELSLYPLLTTDEAPAGEVLQVLERSHAGLLTRSAAAVSDCAELAPRTLFLPASAPDGALSAVHGRCRYLVETADELRRLDALAAPLLPVGYLEDVAIRVWPSGGGEFTAQNIPAFARLIRRTENLAVRALFLPFDRNGNLSRQAKDAFSLVKKIRSDLPCMLHAFCFEGLLEPLTLGDTELLHTLKMLSSLNDTSLYAVFFLS